MSYCLPKFAAEEFKKALKAGSVKPSELASISSAERRAIFEKYMNPMQAQNTNALFESKLLLKNQQKGIITWAKKVTGITPDTRRDLIAKVERLDQAMNETELASFKEDLIEKRLGFGVTPKEAETISTLATKAEEARVAIPDNAPLRSPERMKYGARAVALKDYVDAIKEAAKDNRAIRYLNPVTTAELLGGISKSVVASFDNSFFGNQGIKMLFTNPDIWTNSFLRSWGDIAVALRGGDPLKFVHADILSRPNTLNGKFKIGGYELDILSEEAFPSTIPGKIPVLKRLYKASEAAYNGAALRMRADYADRVIKTAERLGVDTTDPEQAIGLGRMVNSTTGRGSLDLGPGANLEPSAKVTNALLFSGKFLKSNIDTLFFGLTDPKIATNKVALAIAAGNTVKIMAGIAGILKTAELLWPGSVEWDPKSSDFGQVKIGDTRFNVSGGMSSIVTLASRLSSIRYDEKLGRYTYQTKSSSSGKTSTLGTGKFGDRTALDVTELFLEGKLSPFAGAIRDMLKSEFYDRTPFTFKQAAINQITPIPFQTSDDLLKNPNAAPYLAAMIASGLGLGANTYSPQ